MKKLITTLFLSVAAMGMHAVPARPVWRTVQQADGTTLQIMQCGDERLHYFITRDSAVVLQSADGSYRYAYPESNEIRISDILAHEATVRTSEERSFVLTPQQIFSVIKTPLMGSSRGLSTKKKVVKRTDYIGEKRQLVILVNFSDVKFNTAKTFKFWDDLFNKQGFSEEGAFGSVSDYFYAQSLNQFKLQFDLVGPIELAEPVSFYGDNVGGDDKGAAQMVIEAATKALAGKDLSAYDWDKDGNIDQVLVIYAGKGENDGGSASSVWPHQWTLTEAHDRNDGTGAFKIGNYTIDSYGVFAELDGDSKYGSFGTICHEFGHCLGLPDFYATNNSRYNPMSTWDIMATGNYNGNGMRPAGYTAWEREFLGWVNVPSLESPATISDVKPLADGGNAYRVRNFALDADADEYYMLENRQRMGWDEFIPNSGLTVLHVDYDAKAWAENTVNNNSSHPRYSLVAANGDKYGILPSGWSFPYGSNDALTSTSNPAANVYNENSTGYTLGKDITAIKAENGVVSFDFMGGNALVTSVITTATDTTSTYEGEEIVDVYELDGTPVAMQIPFPMIPMSPDRKGDYRKFRHIFTLKDPKTKTTRKPTTKTATRSGTTARPRRKAPVVVVFEDGSSVKTIMDEE